MLNDLTPEQWAKIKRGWVWQVGQKSQAWPMRVESVTPSEYKTMIRLSRRVLADGRLGGHIGFTQGTEGPDLNDRVTADGLLRTARAMWEAKILERYGFGVHLFAIRRGHQWNISVCDAGAGELFVRPVGIGGTEDDAWMAAILAAPEEE